MLQGAGGMGWRALNVDGVLLERMREEKRREGASDKERIQMAVTPGIFKSITAGKTS